MKLGIVIAVKGRELRLVHNCLKALENQTERADDIVLVDGSELADYKILPYAGIHHHLPLVGPWNKSLLLNRGIRVLIERGYAPLDCIATLDVDMIVHPDHVKCARVGFNEEPRQIQLWENRSLSQEAVGDTYETLKPQAQFLQRGIDRTVVETVGPASWGYGGWQGLPAHIWATIRGYDETLIEDLPHDYDLVVRLCMLKVPQMWHVEDPACAIVGGRRQGPTMLHQWHPRAATPSGCSWYKNRPNWAMRLFYTKPQRNTDGWGGWPPK